MAKEKKEINGQKYVNDLVQATAKKGIINIEFSSASFASLSDASKLFLDQASSSADEPVLSEIDLSGLPVTTDTDLSLLMETARINGSRKKKANANPASIQH